MNDASQRRRAGVRRAPELIRADQDAPAPDSDGAGPGLGPEGSTPTSAKILNGKRPELIRETDRGAAST